MSPCELCSNPFRRFVNNAHNSFSCFFNHNKTNKETSNMLHTKGIVSSVQWTKQGSSGGGKPEKDTLSFTIDPTAPFSFEKQNGGKTEKYVLFADYDEKNFERAEKIATDTDFVVDTTDPSASFSALLLLKQNRTKVSIQLTDSASLSVQKLDIQ